MGELAEAVVLLEEAVQGRMETLGDDHPDTQQSVFGLNMLRGLVQQ